MDASLEDLRGRQRFRQACHSKEQAYRVNLIATRYSSHAPEPRRCPLTSSGRRCKVKQVMCRPKEWVDPTQTVAGAHEGISIVLSLATSLGLLRQFRYGSGEAPNLVPLNECFSRALQRKIGTRLLEGVARNHGRPDYSVSYPLLVSRYLMVPGLNVETRQKRLDKAGAYLLFTGINPAGFIGRRGLHPDNRIISEESHHAL